MMQAICPICNAEIRTRQKAIVRRYTDGWRKIHEACAEPLLSPAQQAALANCAPQWQSAYEIGATLATLDALVRLGILEHHAAPLGALFSPRTANYYRIKRPDA